MKKSSSPESLEAAPPEQMEVGYHPRRSWSGSCGFDIQNAALQERLELSLGLLAFSGSQSDMLSTSESHAKALQHCDSYVSERSRIRVIRICLKPNECRFRR